MAFPTYTYTLTNGSTADATQVNQNFSDILNGISDTTKSISVAAITAAGTTTLSGPVILGLSSSSDLTFNGSIATTINVKTNTTFDVGSATLGLRSVYIGGTSTFTTRILGAATATWTLTLPTTAGTGGQYLTTDGSGVTSWGNVSEPLLVQNLGMAATVATNALTVALKTSTGVDPSSTSPVYASFRNATSATGQYSTASRSSALSIVVPSGASLGHTASMNQYVWVYLVNDAGTIDIGVSGGNPFDDGTPTACTQISAGATSATVLYTTSTHSGSMPTRLVGRLLVNEVTAGTWATAPTELVLMPVPKYCRTVPVSYTPTFSSGFTGVGSIAFASYRDGQWLVGMGVFINTTAAAASAFYSIGYNGTSANVTMVNTPNAGTGYPVGYYAGSNTGGQGAMLWTVGATTAVAFGMATTTAGSPNAIANGNAVSASGASMSSNYRVQITGWTDYGPP